MAEHPTIIKTYGLRAPPVGARYFLRRYPHLKLPQNASRFGEGLSDDRLLEARIINRDVNEMLIHTPDDEELWGNYEIVEHWIDDVLKQFIKGDCDDACVRKLQLFTEAGLPRAAFRLLACKVRSGFRWEKHLVVIARTYEGRYLVFDNRTNEAYDYEKAVKAAVLKPLAMEKPHGTKWYRLAPPPMFSLAALTQRITGDT